ncbi:MAG: ABC transporter permease [Armatimonadota bacterium]|nr:ABC transporter permease [Armatimonadota bacterium]
MVFRYVRRRLALLVPVVVGITVLVFLLAQLAPGDPVIVMLGPEYDERTAARLRRELGLDRPLVIQYLRWLARAARGDLGRDFISKVPVTDQIGARLPTTLLLTGTTMVVALAVGIPVGVLSAVRRDSLADHLGRVVAMIGVSVPVFWLGMLLIMAFAVRIQWFPPGGSVREYGLRALVLPAVALGLSFAALITRITRAALLEVLGLDYVRTARAKGLAQRVIVYHHALRNALIPIVTIVGLQVGTLLSGAMLTETIFSLPGLGRLLMESVSRRDYPLLQACVLVTTLLFVLANLVVDVLYAYLDPRITYA